MTLQISQRHVAWNPYNKVVQSHADGTIYMDLTNLVRKRLGLPVPWTPEHADHEVMSMPPVHICTLIGTNVGT